MSWTKPQFRLTTILLFSALLNACAPPMPAPVISREHGMEYQRPAYTPRMTRPGYYQIKRGDTIYSIAWRYGLDYREFAQWNNIRYPYRIHPGQYLRVTRPAGSSSTHSYAVITPAQDSRSQSVTPFSQKINPKTRDASKNESYGNLKLHWIWPTQGNIRTGFRSGDQSRKGVTLSGRLGQQVKAAEAGTVVYSGSGLIGYGKLIIIKHNKNYLSAYGHNQKLLVKEGDKVRKGAHIANMGKNGSGNIVLHFEIRRNGVPVDPLPLLPRKS